MFKFFTGVSVSFSPFNLGKSHIYILSLGWRLEMWKQKLNQFLLKYSISLLHSSIIFATLGLESLQDSNMQPLLAKVLISSNTSENVKNKQKKPFHTLLNNLFPYILFTFFSYLFYVEIVRNKKKTHVQPTILS